jgi:hypothetical protein
LFIYAAGGQLLGDSLQLEEIDLLE